MLEESALTDEAAHDAAEAAAVAMGPATIGADAVPHDLMPWVPEVRVSYSTRTAVAPSAWVVSTRRACVLGAKPFVALEPLSIDDVLALDARTLRKLHAAQTVRIEPATEYAARQARVVVDPDDDEEAWDAARS